MSGCFGLLVRHLLFLFPDSHKHSRDCPDGDEPARHKPVTSDVAEAVDQHRGKGGEYEAESYNERDRDGRAGDVFDDERAGGRLGAIDESLKHVAP